MRVYRSLTGAPAGFEQTLIRCAWTKHDGGQRIAVGGGDRTVTVWEVETGKVLYKLPGHKGTVTSVDFHPRYVIILTRFSISRGKLADWYAFREPIILTGSKDTNMLLGELDAQDFS